MFSESYESVFTQERLLAASESYKMHPQFGMLKQTVGSGALYDALKSGTYIPGAAQQFDLPKRSGGMRPIAAASLEDRVVQKVLVEVLQPHFKFSDKSYAYRQGKGPARAVKRVMDFINRGNFWAVRTDIKSFFDTINHKTLAKMLSKHIEDQRIVQLIILFFKSGIMKKLDYHDHLDGIHQGGPLSPFLSNLYLDPFDRYLEERSIEFVRFGDDIVMLGPSKEHVAGMLAVSRKKLHELKLDIKTKKTVVASIATGFEYLGVYLHNHTVRIEHDRLKEKVDALKKDTKNLDIADAVTLINDRIRGFEAYYRKVITDFSQAKVLQDAVDTILTKKIAGAKSAGTVTRQAEFRNLLAPLRTYFRQNETALLHYHNTLISSAYDLLKSAKPVEAAEKKIAKKKAEIFKDQYASTEIVLAKPGVYLGFTRGKAVVKEKGRVVRSFPINRITRVIILNSVTLSSEIIYRCSKQGIDIDFIRKDEPYAMISYYHQAAYALQQKQHAGFNGNRFIGAAKSIIFAKIKNQINLVKYHARYRKKSNPELFAKLSSKVKLMAEIAHKLHHLHDKNAIRGIEGSCSALYWECFGLIITNPRYERITRDAPDAVNQALNYGYAILYHRVQSALLKAHLDIYAPLFHEPQANKPVLVFDVIEEFRQGVVDREIISILNHHKKLTTSKGKLTQESVKLVTEHVQSRLSGLTNYRGKKFRFADVIIMQAQQLAKWIDDGVTYKPMVVRY
jgi:group II intron reverse transcriptase/maturase/CRISPR-associated endonuclease Cas1